MSSIKSLAVYELICGDKEATLTMETSLGEVEIQLVGSDPVDAGVIDALTMTGWLVEFKYEVGSGQEGYFTVAHYVFEQEDPTPPPQRFCEDCGLPVYRGKVDGVKTSYFCDCPPF